MIDLINDLIKQEYERAERYKAALEEIDKIDNCDSYECKHIAKEALKETE